MSDELPELRILPELEGLLRKLTDDEFAQLEANILREGRAIDPIWVWRGIIVDGHNRYRICRKHGLPYSVKEVFAGAETVDEVRRRMILLSLGRRNLEPAQMAQYRAILAKEKAASDALKEAVNEVASESGVSSRTVYRDVEKAKTIDSLTRGIKDRPVLWQVPLSDLKKLATFEGAEQEDIIEKAGDDKQRIKEEIRRRKPVQRDAYQHPEEDREREEAETVTESDVRRQKIGRPTEAKDVVKLCRDGLITANKSVAKIRQSLGEAKYRAFRHHLQEADAILGTYLESIDDFL